MTVSFEDISIVDLDLKKTTWSRVHSSMRTLYLKLSREPEIGWTRFFHEERESRVVLKRHGLWIEDGYIVFDCLLEDVEKYHLPDFRPSVVYANGKYRELLQARRDDNEQMRENARDEQEELADLRERIRIAESNEFLPIVPKMVAAKIISERAAVQQTPVVAETAEPADVAPLNKTESNPDAPSVPSEKNEAVVVEQPTPQTANVATADIPDFTIKRDEWRARFRAALAARNEESDRGND
jgi:hypothetical protein